MRKREGEEALGIEGRGREKCMKGVGRQARRNLTRRERKMQEHGGRRRERRMKNTKVISYFFHSSPD